MKGSPVINPSFLIKNMKKYTITINIESQLEGGYIGYITEIPGINTQGETINEVESNLFEILHEHYRFTKNENLCN